MRWRKTRALLVTREFSGWRTASLLRLVLDGEYPV
jgi:hypothetical protein